MHFKTHFITNTLQVARAENNRGRPNLFLPCSNLFLPFSSSLKLFFVCHLQLENLQLYKTTTKYISLLVKLVPQA